MSEQQKIVNSAVRQTLVVALPAGEFNREKLASNPNLVGGPNGESPEQILRQTGLLNLKIDEDTVLQYNTNLNIFTLYKVSSDTFKENVYEILKRALELVEHTTQENGRPGPIMISRNYVFGNKEIDFAFNNVYNTFNPGKYLHLGTQINITYEKPGFPYRIIASLVKPDEESAVLEIGFINNVNGVVELKEIIENVNNFSVNETKAVFKKVDSFISSFSNTETDRNLDEKSETKSSKTKKKQQYKTSSLGHAK